MNYVIYLKQYQSLEKKNLVQLEQTSEQTSDMGKDGDQTVNQRADITIRSCSREKLP